MHLSVKLLAPAVATAILSGLAAPVLCVIDGNAGLRPIADVAPFAGIYLQSIDCCGV